MPHIKTVNRCGRQHRYSIQSLFAAARLRLSLGGRGDGTDMTHLPEIWESIRSFLSESRWTALQDIYTHVQRTLPLDDEDDEPQAPGSTIPKWKRNVRAVLQYRKGIGEVVWNGNKQYRLKSEAPTGEIVCNDAMSANEGRVLLRLHRSRERSRRLVSRKKRIVLAQDGRLACEVCEFDFAEVYGPLGEGFAECHHTLPLSHPTGARRTQLDDLAVVCANCHRMLHRRPWHTIAELRELLADVAG